MTKEEAIFCEKSYIGETNCTDCKYYIADTCLSRESHKMAIKALEQDSILSEARAKIEEQEKWLSEAGYNAYNVDIAFESVKRALKK